MGHFRPKTGAHKVRFGVRSGKAQNEQMSSGLHPKADKQQTPRDAMTGLMRCSSKTASSDQVVHADRPAIRGMVRFLRRRGHGQGKALTLGGVAETFVALNRGPRVQAMEI